MTIFQQELVISHLNFARKFAAIKKKKCSFVNYDELESAAFLGLSEAAHKYNFLGNFKAFAHLRIEGAIKDYLRELAYGSRRNSLKRENLCLEQY